MYLNPPWKFLLCCRVGFIEKMNLIWLLLFKFEGVESIQGSLFRGGLTQWNKMLAYILTHTRTYTHSINKNELYLLIIYLFFSIILVE